MAQSPFQKVVQALRDQRPVMDMRAAFAADPGRFARFSAGDGDLLLDWSKCAVDARTMELLGELAHQIGHVVHLEVVAFDDIETEALERRRHASGVPHRIGQGRHRRIGAVADDERHAALGNGSLGGRTERNSTEHQRKGRSHSSTERRNPSCEAHHNLPCSIRSRNAAGGGRSRDKHD